MTGVWAVCFWLVSLVLAGAVLSALAVTIAGLIRSIVRYVRR